MDSGKKRVASMPPFFLREGVRLKGKIKE